LLLNVLWEKETYNFVVSIVNPMAKTKIIFMPY